MTIKTFSNVDYECPHCKTIQDSFCRWLIASVKDVHHIQTKTIEEAKRIIRGDLEDTTCPNCDGPISLPNDLMP